MTEQNTAEIDHPAAAGRRAPEGLYGLMARFESAEALVKAAEAARLAGYRRMDGYSPIPIPELHAALGQRRSRLPLLVLLGGITGCLTGFFMQWFARNVHYPVNIGGKPLNAWPMFIPITFELTVLFAGLTCTFAMLALNGFPRYYHPVFNVPSFERATTDGFFLCIEATDEKFNIETTRQFLEGLHPAEVAEVAR